MLGVDRPLFWRALLTQGLLVGLLFGTLAALPLPHDFFERWGFLVGPVAWAACALVSARLLRLPLAFVLFCALAGGVAGVLVLLAASHLAGMVAALLVFAASCSGYGTLRESEGGSAR